MSREPASCTTALTYYWRSALWLAPGEIIQPGNWGKVILAFGARHPRFYAEYLFERIRQAEFAARPSRMRAAFAFFDEARRLRATLLGRGAICLAEVGDSVRVRLYSDRPGGIGRPPDQRTQTGT